MLLICCFLIERLLTFTLECFPWLSCYVNLCFCLPQRLFGTQQLGCDVTATECLFTKDKIKWVNVYWPFSLVYRAQLCWKQKCHQTCEQICVLCLCLWGPHSYTWTPWPCLTSSSSHKVNSKGSRRPVASPVPLTKPMFVCLAYETVSDRETMWAVAFIWMLSLRKHSLSGTVQWLSVSQFVHLSFKVQKELQ